MSADETPDASRGLGAGRTIEITFDPARGVGIGWKNMSAYEVLAALELARKATLDMIAPSPANPLVNVPRGTGGAQAFVGRKVS